MPTKAEYQQTNDELRSKLAAYEALGSPEFIKEKLRSERASCRERVSSPV